MTTAPTPLRVGNAGVYQEAGKTLAAAQAIIADAREWGLLGIDLEWNKDGRITWVGLGTERRAVAFWWPSLPEDTRDVIKAAMADPLLPKLGQNGIQADKPRWEAEIGPTGGRWEDTMLLHHAAFPGIAHDLQAIVAQFQVVPPWKAWRREANRQAAQARATALKEEKKQARVLKHTTANADKKAVAEAERARKKAEKAAVHAAKNAAAAAEKERKRLERQAAHEARNAQLAAQKLARKNYGRKPALPPSPPPPAPEPGVVIPLHPEIETGTGPRPDDIPFDVLPANGLLCPLCGEPQRISPSGAICVNNHGGVEGYEPPPPPAPPPPVSVEAPRTLLRAPARPGRFAHGPAAAPAPPAPPALSPSVPAPDPLPGPAAASPPTPTPPPARWPNGGNLLPGRVAGRVSYPAPGTRRELTVIVEDAEGNEQVITVPREE